MMIRLVGLIGKAVTKVRKSLIISEIKRVNYLRRLKTYLVSLSRRWNKSPSRISVSSQNLRFHIDQDDKCRITKRALLITGWCFDLLTNEACEIRMQVNGKYYSALPTSRPEVSEHFSGLDELPELVGFACILTTPPGMQTIKVEALGCDSEWSVLDEITITRQNVPSQKNILPVKYLNRRVYNSESLPAIPPNITIGVAYLARGADDSCMHLFSQFISSYKSNHSGVDHSLYVIYKGFESCDRLQEAQNLFSQLNHIPIHLEDDSFDIGAYVQWARLVDDDYILPLNTASEIKSEMWLAKFAQLIVLPKIGIVGTSGSYESLKVMFENFPSYPNVHIRSNAFIIARDYFVELTAEVNIKSKQDAYEFESGNSSLTNKVISSGEDILLAGRDGNGYPPEFWPESNIFRYGNQGNLLIADNQSRIFDELEEEAKMFVILNTWGSEFINNI